MTIEEEKRKNEIVIKYLKTKFPNLKCVAEYSTDDKNLDVIVVQEQAGQKEVFFDNETPLYNYYNIDIFGNNIKTMKDISVEIGNLIGQMVMLENIQNNTKEKWQIIFNQITNPQTVSYSDIRRVSYNMTLQCVVNIVDRETINVPRQTKKGVK